MKKLILGSGSPRRKSLLSDLEFSFEVRVQDTDESYPEELKGADIAKFIARQKAIAIQLEEDEVLLTADTTVHINDDVLAKPSNDVEAFEMIQMLSGQTHQVTTGVCFRTTDSIFTDSSTTQVTFRSLTDREIWHYIHTYKPFDKAGSYGIQEWIGQIGITSIDGCYFNVVGLPTSLVYTHLKNLLGE